MAIQETTKTSSKTELEHIIESLDCLCSSIAVKNSALHRLRDRLMGAAPALTSDVDDTPSDGTLSTITKLISTAEAQLADMDKVLSELENII